MHWEIPVPVREIMLAIMDCDHSAYLVGGVVRDLVMGRQPRDYDVCTSATPDTVKRIFLRTLSTGEKHGTITVIHAGSKVEVTTLRRESGYTDCRRPDQVMFTRSLEEDMARRDFTVNSLAMDLAGNIYDYFGGLDDIGRRLIRAVGDPGLRFTEDGLRLLRAVRFACQLQFDIEEKTMSALTRYSCLIERISASRVRDEFNAVLLSDLPHRGLEIMLESGLMGSIFPELADEGVNVAQGGSINHAIEVVKRTPPCLAVRLAALLAGPAGPALAGEILRRLKYDRKTIRKVESLIGGRVKIHDFTDVKRIKMFMAAIGTDNIEDYLDFSRAAAQAAGRQQELDTVIRLKAVVRAVLEKGDPLSVKDLAVNGHDLAGIGVREGRETGLFLQRLLEAVLEDPSLNRKEALLDLVSLWDRNGRNKKGED